MSTIAYHRKSQFHEQLCQLRREGGPKGQAYNKISQIRLALEHGLEPGVPTTNNGETRIHNCIKYDLGNGLRLVTIRSGDVVFFCFAGDHDKADRWLDRNRGLVLVKNRDQSITLLHEATREGPLPESNQAVDGDRPLYKMVEEVNWQKIFPHPVTLKAFKRLMLFAEEREIAEFINDIKVGEGEEKAGLIQDLIIACRQRDSETARAVEQLLSGESSVVSSGQSEVVLSKEDVRAEINSEQVVVLNGLSDEEIERLWNPAMFQEWMVYLHPGQKRIVNEDFSMPAVLGGVSGSGKTCVLIHRAVRLAEKYPNEPILILTLNRSLTYLIKNLLQKLTDGKQRRIQVESYADYVSRILFVLGLDDFFTDIGRSYNLDAELQQFLQAAGQEQRAKFFSHRDKEEVDQLWRKFSDDKDSGGHLLLKRVTNYFKSREATLDAEDYIREELDLIRSAFPFTTEYEGYIDYRRPGRSINLQQAGRKRDLTQLTKAWDRYQYRHGLLDPMTLSQITQWMKDNEKEIPSSLRYRCVLVDEYQDFSTQELRFINSIPTQKENGLFLTGDSGQKIYPKDFNMADAGLARHTQHHERRILKNYRNSREILEAAHLLLEAYAAESTAKAEGVTTLAPEYAIRSTAKPFAAKTNQAIEAAWKYAQDWMDGGCPGYAIAIISADELRFPPAAIIAAAPNYVEAKRLSADYQLEGNKVIVSDLQTVKGFEFSLVIVVGNEDGAFPDKGKARGELWRDALRLYVAMTRARDELVLIYEDKPSEFLRVMAPKLSEKEILFDDSQGFAVPEGDERDPDIVDPEIEKMPPELSIPEILVRPQEQSIVISQKETSPLRGRLPDKPVEFQTHSSPRQFSPVVNGINILHFNGDENLNQLSEKLGKSAKSVEQVLWTEWQCVYRPTDTIPRSYVRKICAYYHCQASFSSPDIIHEAIRVPKIVTNVSVGFTGYQRAKCESIGCENFAMYGSNFCRSCDPEN